MRGPQPPSDELTGGSEREPLQVPRWLQGVALLLAAAAVGVVLVTRDSGSPDGPSAAPTTSAPHAAAPAGTPPGLVPGPGSEPLTGPLRAPDLCVTTDQHTLTVRFTVENASLSRVTLLTVRGRLPIGGLVATGVRLPAPRPCDGVTDAGTTLVLEPGRKVPVALQFRLPPECPAPYPVFADVSFVGRGETPMTQELALLSDLGGYDFTSCQR